MIPLVVEAIIFDLDGTIVNSLEVHWEAFNEQLSQFNVQISWNDWTGEYLGKKSRMIWESVAKKHKLSVNFEKAQKVRRENYNRLVDEGKLKEIDGFSAFYNWLKISLNSSIPIVIASNGYVTSIKVSLKAIGYLNKINFYSASSGPRTLTKEELFRSVVNDLRVNSNNCVVLEDSPLGAIAAKKNGMKVIIVNTNNLPESKFDADLVIKDYNDPELFSFIERLSDDSA